jgi:hypothetical protein
MCTGRQRRSRAPLFRPHQAHAPPSRGLTFPQFRVTVGNMKFGRGLASALLACASVSVAGLAWAADTLVVQERFTPNRLGAPTNLSITADFSTTPGPPSPATRLTLYAPAGLTVDARYADVCTLAKLELEGPPACPPNSRAGFGGGVAVYTLPRETIHEPFTVDFFFASSAHGHIALLAYASATTPVTIELTVVVREVRAPKPYGLGFTVEIPPIAPLPGVPPASIESAFATFGSASVAYYEHAHHKRTLVHLRGLIAPKRCPRGGFPSKATIDFADGTSLTVNPTFPCPRGRA